MLQGDETLSSMLSWESHTLKRRMISTLSAETQAIAESAAVACWFRYLVTERFYKDLINSGHIGWETMLEPHEFGIFADAKFVYDVLTSSNHSNSNTLINVLVSIWQSSANSCIRWIDGSVQIADSLNNFMTSDFLRSVIARGSYQM